MVLKSPCYNEVPLYKQATQGTNNFKVLSKGLGNGLGQSALPQGSTAAASGFELGTSWLRVHGVIH